METDVAVMAERRAKLAKLRSEHFVAGEEHFPSIHLALISYT